MPPGDTGARTPILVELFTSEGCSSCPPADLLLQKLDALQPIPGTEIIVLSEHVDYWNHDGWVDPFSSPEFTVRQRAYVFHLGVAGPYTPEMVVDGSHDVLGNDPRKVEQTLHEAARDPKWTVRLGPGTGPDSVTVDVNVPAVQFPHRAVDLIAFFAQDHSESDVSAGENRGRHLSHVAVVRTLRILAVVEKETRFQTQLSIAGRMRQRLIVIAQERNTGKVLGAALYKIPG